MPLLTANEKSSRYNRKGKKKKNKVNTPAPFTNNKFINKFESFMAKHKLTYKGLYTFPYYAIGIALAILLYNLCWHEGDLGDCLAGVSVLSIPLYYTFIKAIERSNANYFEYPIVTIILLLLPVGIGFGKISATWLATIPFYYWFVNKNK